MRNTDGSDMPQHNRCSAESMEESEVQENATFLISYGSFNYHFSWQAFDSDNGLENG